MTPTPLRERIKNAATVEEVSALLLEGTTYKFANGKTRRRRMRAGLARSAELNSKKR